MFLKSLAILGITSSIWVFGGCSKSDSTLQSSSSEQGQTQTVLQKSEAQRFFEGEHELGKLVQFVSVEGRTALDSYFLIEGGKLYFMWKSNQENIFIISSIEPGRVRVSIGDDPALPKVKFQCFYKDDCKGDDILERSGQQGYIDQGYIANIIIYVKPGDWPLKIQTISPANRIIINK